MIRVAYVVTAPRQSVRLFLRGHLGFLQRSGFEVSLIAPPGPDLDEAARREGVAAWPVPIERDIAPLQDVVSLVRLVTLLRRIRPQVVNAGTPKAGFLGMLAARIVGVPVRVYHLRALRLETTAGWERRLLAGTERIAGASATRIVSISPSLAARFAALGLAPERKIVVFGRGSSNGIECDRFVPTEARRSFALEARRKLGIGDGDPVIGFVGRLIPDKGIPQLFEAFEGVLEVHPAARLLLVGDREAHHPFDAGFLDRLARHPRVHRVSYQDDPAPYYTAIDVFAFPSLREGFGNVALEAAAAGLPVVGFRATGVVDAIADGETGTLVPLGDVPAVTAALSRYLGDPVLRRAHGTAGAERARRDFRPESIWSSFAQEYRRLLREAGLEGTQPDGVPPS